LNHLDKASFPEVTLEIDSQNLTVEYVGSTEHKGLETVDIIGFFFFEFLGIFHVDQKLFFAELFLEGTLARFVLELFKDMGIYFGIEDKLSQREEQE
jgi:hypothetical protein